MLAQAQGASLYEILRNADLFPELKSAASKLMKFADLIDGLRRAGGELALPEFYDEVLERTGYVRALEEKNDLESRGRIENVQELKSNILGFLEQDPEDATLSGFLNEIALYTDLDSVEAGDDCVTMMTAVSYTHLIFYRTDHHWTSLGAYYGYAAVMETLGRAEDTLPMSAFTPETASTDFNGTLYSQSGIHWLTPDTIEFWVQDDGLSITSWRTGEPQSGTLYDRSYLEKKDKYSAFLGGNQPPVSYTHLDTIPDRNMVSSP